MVSPVNKLAVLYGQIMETDQRTLLQPIRAYGLNRDSLSRHVYLDESGTDIHSSVAIVAAVIVDTDTQWKPVEKYIHGLIEEFVPPEDSGWLRVSRQRSVP